MKKIFGYEIWQIPLKMPQRREKVSEERLEKICRGYEKWMSNATPLRIPTDKVDKIKPTRQEIEEFCWELKRYKDESMKKVNGPYLFTMFTPEYLTALLMSCPEKEFTLNFGGVVLDCLGILLEGKKITIEGDVGNWLGEYAKSCEINVTGHAQRNVGSYSEQCKISVGSYDSLSANIGKETRIYCKGNRVWPKLNKD